jgi:hypothetical protein
MHRRWIIILVAALAIGFLLACALMVLGGRAFLAWLSLEPKGIAIEVEQPTVVRKGEPFPIDVLIQNEWDHVRVLMTIHVDAGYLQGIAVTGCEPAYESEYPVGGVTGDHEYVFLREIGPEQALAIRFRAMPMHGGDYSGYLHVCITTAETCLRQMLHTMVED